MTAGGMCASEATLPPHRHPQGSPQGGPQGVTPGGIERGAQGGVKGSVEEGVQGQRMPLTLPSENAGTAAAQTVQADIDDGNHPLTKAGILVRHLLEPAAVLAMLGFNTREVLDLALQTQQQQVASKSQTQAGAQLSSVDGPKSAKISTAAVSDGTEAAEAVAGHPLTNDLHVCAKLTAQADQQQAKGKKDCGGSLLTLLGLGAVTEGSGGGANRLTPAGLGEEEEARLQVDRQAGIALHVVEALLNAALIQPEVSSFPSLPHPLSLTWPPFPKPSPHLPCLLHFPFSTSHNSIIWYGMMHVVSILMICTNFIS